MKAILYSSDKGNLLGQKVMKAHFSNLFIVCELPNLVAVYV